MYITIYLLTLLINTHFTYAHKLIYAQKATLLKKKATLKNSRIHI
jgi:hypothetical protein